jgi:hypothetical protein
MIRVTVELVPYHGERPTTLAVAYISNTGGDTTAGNYKAQCYGGKPFDDRRPQSGEPATGLGEVRGYARLERNVFDLVALALKAAGFGKG